MIRKNTSLKRILRVMIPPRLILLTHGINLGEEITNTFLQIQLFEIDFRLGSILRANSDVEEHDEGHGFAVLGGPRLSK
jgi:hypothetical protein